DRIFNEMKITLKRQGVDILGDVTIARKEEALPLMVADFLGATYSMIRVSKNVGALDYASEAPTPPKRRAGFSILELRPDALRKLKADFERARQRGIDEWRAHRNAKKAIPVSSSEEPQS